jgi:hypothetical protein
LILIPNLPKKGERERLKPEEKTIGSQQVFQEKSDMV